MAHVVIVGGGFGGGEAVGTAARRGGNVGGPADFCAPLRPVLSAFKNVRTLLGEVTGLTVFIREESIAGRASLRMVDRLAPQNEISGGKVVSRPARSAKARAILERGSAGYGAGWARPKTITAMAAKLAI